jgi:hypothetical protein
MSQKQVLSSKRSSSSDLRMLDENIQIQTVNTSAPKVFSAAANSARIGGTR